MILLHLRPVSHVYFPHKKPPSPSASEALFRTFEDSLVRHLNSLIPDPAGPRPAASFSYLSRAIDVLASIHALSHALLSDSSLSGSDDPAVASYVAISLKILDICNAVSAEIDRLRRGRLLLIFAAHLLSSSAPPLPDKIRKARESIREWQGLCPRPGISTAAADLVRGLVRPEGRPRGKVTALGRAVHAVEDVSALITGALVTSLWGEVDLALGVRVPGEFAWGEAFDELRAALSGEVSGRSHGEEAVRRLMEIMEDPAGEKADRLGNAVRELEDATEELTEGLDGLSSAVNGLFRGVLGARDTALESFRLRPNRCK